MRIIMGNTYWRANRTTQSYDLLWKFLSDYGLVFKGKDKDSSCNNIEFNRVLIYTDKSNSITYRFEWYINLVNLDISSPSSSVRVVFNSIKGSYSPIVNHEVISLMYDNHRVADISVPSES